MNENSRRLLIVDDDPTIRQMMAALLRNAARNESSSVAQMRARLFKNSATPGSAEPSASSSKVEYRIDMADQGQKAYEMAQAAVEAKDPYLMAFLDMRMPPGWDGVETMMHLWEADPNLQIALCSAYSDYSWEEIVERAARKQNLLILKKPFEYAEAAQMALALSEKSLVTRRMSERVEALNRIAGSHAALAASNNVLEATIGSLTEVLVSLIEMGNPLAFSHAQRIKAYVGIMASELGLPDVWCYEQAAVLSQLGCLTVPEGSLRRYFSGSDMPFEERSIILGYPTISSELVAKIPGLETLGAMIGFRDELGDASLVDFSLVGPVEAGAWMLRVAVDFDILLSRHSKTEVVETMRKAKSEYPARLLDILAEKAPDERPRLGSVSMVPILQLENGMTLNCDIVARDGVVVARKDQAVSSPLLKRIRNFLQAGLLDCDSVEVFEPSQNPR